MKSPRNPWPYAIILTFIVFICGTIGLVVMASSQRVDLVSNNYYEQELKYQGQIERAKHARQLNTPTLIAYDRTHQQIALTLPQEHSGRPLTGQIQLYRPSEAALDRQFRLQPDTQGHQTLDASNLRPGLWKIHIDWTVDKEDFATDQQVVIATNR